MAQCVKSIGCSQPPIMGCPPLACKHTDRAFIHIKENTALTMESWVSWDPWQHHPMEHRYTSPQTQLLSLFSSTFHYTQVTKPQSHSSLRTMGRPMAAVTRPRSYIHIKLLFWDKVPLCTLAVLKFPMKTKLLFKSEICLPLHPKCWSKAVCHPPCIFNFYKHIIHCTPSVPSWHFHTCT